MFTGNIIADHSMNTVVYNQDTDAHSRTVEVVFRNIIEHDMSSKYYMLMNCIKMLYSLRQKHNLTDLKGFCSVEIHQVAYIYNFACIKAESEEGIRSMLDDMAELNVLKKTSNGRYELKEYVIYEI